jgi:hypothetical protein
MASNTFLHDGYKVLASVPVTAVHILGPGDIVTTAPVQFAADYEPVSATLPVTLTWSNGMTGGTAWYTWPVAGSNAVAVTATNYCGSVVTATHPVTVHHIPGVELAPDRAGTADPGSVVVYTYTLANTGNDADTYDLAHHDDQGWTVEYVPVISVGYGQKATISVSVTVPVGTISGTVGTTTITATSQADSGVGAAVIGATTVGHVPGVALEPGSTGIVYPGSAITYTHILTNTGNYTDAVVLQAVSSQGWSAQVVGRPHSVGTGSAAVLYVRLTIPSGVISGTVNHTVVTATSGFDAAVSSVVTNTATVADPLPVKVYLPLVLRGSQ